MVYSCATGQGCSYLQNAENTTTEHNTSTQSSLHVASDEGGQTLSLSCTTTTIIPLLHLIRILDVDRYSRVHYALPWTSFRGWKCPLFPLLLCMSGWAQPVRAQGNPADRSNNGIKERQRTLPRQLNDHHFVPFPSWKRHIIVIVPVYYTKKTPPIWTHTKESIPTDCIGRK